MAGLDALRPQFASLSNERGLLLRARERESKNRTAGLTVLRPNAPAVRFDDHPRKRQADAETRRLRCEKRVKDF